jgi:hypothetical protein
MSEKRNKAAQRLSDKQPYITVENSSDELNAVSMRLGSYVENELASFVALASTRGDFGADVLASEAVIEEIDKNNDGVTWLNLFEDVENYFSMLWQDYQNNAQARQALQLNESHFNLLRKRHLLLVLLRVSKHYNLNSRNFITCFESAMTAKTFYAKY